MALPEEDWHSAPPSLPLGTRDERPRSVDTRIDSPAARTRTPHRPPPVPPSDRGDERVGMVLGTYRLLELIGKGGMGFVYRAEHTKLGREVALKLLRSDYARRRDAVSRFFQEARTVNRVRHRNIVDVTDFIELDDGTTFIIMELLRGKSLGAWARDAYDLPRALAALIQICDGLSAAHAVGVIHRDLKPDNVVLVPTADGAELVKLLDFGVAKLLNRDDEDVGLETAAGSVIGTPAYMSPEQAGGLVVDNRADIYSLGAIMYELFCGQPLFRGRSFGEYVRKHLNEHPVPPRQTPGGALMDPRLEGVLMRCLAKDPDARYPTAEALRDELLHLLAAIETRPHELLGLSASGLRAPAGTVPAPVGSAVDGSTRDPRGGSVSAGPMAPGVPTPMPGHGSWIAPAPPAGTSRRWLWGAALAATVGVAVAGGLIAASRSTPAGLAPPPAAPPVAPAVTSLVAADPAPRVRVQIDAPGGGQVLAEDGGAALCTTPCLLEIDPGDGGSPTRRSYLVRKDGFRDATFAIDLGAAPAAVPVTLEALPELVFDPPEAVHGDATRPSGRRPEPRRDVRTTPAPTPPPPATTVAPPPDPTPKPKPKDTRVDPTVTIDPFAGG
ncbi:MAG: serine/threonine-protein kinase [Kofleriaceae bacterium]